MSNPDQGREKRGVVSPETTPTQTPGEKQAGSPKERVERLDDDFTKRAADAAAEKLN